MFSVVSIASYDHYVAAVVSVDHSSNKLMLWDLKNVSYISMERTFHVISSNLANIPPTLIIPIDDIDKQAHVDISCGNNLENEIANEDDEISVALMTKRKLQRWTVVVFAANVASQVIHYREIEVDLVILASRICFDEFGVILACIEARGRQHQLTLRNCDLDILQEYSYTHVITALTFLSNQCEFVLTGNENNTLEIFHMDHGVICSQSLSSSTTRATASITSLRCLNVLDNLRWRIIVGSYDNRVYLVDFSVSKNDSHHQFCVVGTLDLLKEMRYRSMSESPSNPAEAPSMKQDTLACPLAISPLMIDTVMIVTSTHVVKLLLSSSSVMRIIDSQNHSAYDVSTLSSAAVSISLSSNMLYVLLLTAFERRLIAMVQSSLMTHEDEESKSSMLTIFGSSRDEDETILTREYDLTESSSSSSLNTICKPMKGSWEQPLRTAQGKLVDMPITFHTSIRSSGYGQVPQDSYSRMKLQKEKKKRQDKKSSAIRGTRIVSYPSRVDPSAWTCQRVIQHRNPLHRLAFNSDGSSLFTVSNESSFDSYSSSSEGKSVSYLGHNGRVRDVDCSLSRSLLLSASVDNTAKLWKGSKNDTPALTFTQPSEVLFSKFFYMDKFIILVSIYLGVDKAILTTLDFDRRSSPVFSCTHIPSKDSMTLVIANISRIQCIKGSIKWCTSGSCLGCL